MTTTTRLSRLLFAAALALPLAAIAQNADEKAQIESQRKAMAPLDYMNGVWRGPATTVRPSGEKHSITQTERIGPFLGGSIKVLEGRGYDASGEVTFNALGVVSFDPAKNAYTLRSWALGRTGDFVLTPNPTGYSWEIPMGPNKIVYTAVIKGDDWHEVGDYVAPGKPPARFFEMRLKRVGPTDWPAGSPVPMK
jgi:hypothetical protein